MATLEPGSYSEGTLLSSDLIPRFVAILQEYNLPVPSPCEEHGHDGDDDCGECRYLLEELFDALSEGCPPGFYFGAHPGDGADFGCWANEDGPFSGEADTVSVDDEPADLLSELADM